LRERSMVVRMPRTVAGGIRPGHIKDGVVRPTMRKKYVEGLALIRGMLPRVARRGGRSGLPGDEKSEGGRTALTLDSRAPAFGGHGGGSSTRRLPPASCVCVGILRMDCRTPAHEVRRVPERTQKYRIGQPRSTVCCGSARQVARSPWPATHSSTDPGWPLPRALRTLLGGMGRRAFHFSGSGGGITSLRPTCRPPNAGMASNYAMPHAGGESMLVGLNLKVVDGRLWAEPGVRRLGPRIGPAQAPLACAGRGVEGRTAGVLLGRAPETGSKTVTRD